jgi:hypothetical protein
MAQASIFNIYKRQTVDFYETSNQQQLEFV